jgi:hypothetical protein
MPVGTTIVPDRWTAPGGEVILDYIRSLFRDARDLVTFMWMVGNAIMDPVYMPKSEDYDFDSLLPPDEADLIFDIAERWRHIGCPLGRFPPADRGPGPCEGKKEGS